MYYKEYVKAAYRHLSTCMNLLGVLSSELSEEK